jgi:hypothetical protein
MIRVILSSFFLIWSFLGFSQETNEVIKDLFPKKAAKGSFQLIFLTHNSDPIHLSSELLELINDSRLENDDIVIPLKENVEVYIPSKQKINNPEFISLEEFIVSPE